MITACKLNNKNMRNLRRSEEYQCVMVDLAMLGVISKEECEMMIGGRIPNNLTLPNGKQGHLISESNLPEQPVVVDAAAKGEVSPDGIIPTGQPTVTGDEDEGTGTGTGTGEGSELSVPDAN